jgi:hypothetical protein
LPKGKNEIVNDKGLFLALGKLHVFFHIEVRNDFWMMLFVWSVKTMWCEWNKSLAQKKHSSWSQIKNITKHDHRLKGRKFIKRVKGVTFVMMFLFNKVWHSIKNNEHKKSYRRNNVLSLKQAIGQIKHTLIDCHFVKLVIVLFTCHWFQNNNWKSLADPKTQK